MKRNLVLLSLLLLLGASLLLLSSIKQRVLKESAPLMREASQRTQAAFAAVRTERIARGLPMNAADDPNDTGMIGELYTGITTTLGALDAKRSTTNPNVAAMIVDMFLSVGLDRGDRVAVNLSSSFPALNIATLAAMDTLGLDGIVMFSVGASTYGATIPEFTYGDMEHLLAEGGFLSSHSSYFSLGGQNDQGLEMPVALREEIVARLMGFGYTWLSYEDVGENVAARYALYQQGGPVRCFVNVGGNQLSFGPSDSMGEQGGILTSLPSGEQGDGLIQRYLSDGVPVLHLLNLKGLLPAYGLPIDPMPLPPVGEGGVYYTETYNKPLGIAVALLNLCALLLSRRAFRPRR